MRFRLFPKDKEGVGNYRIVQPYGMLELVAGHHCYMEVEQTAAGHAVAIPQPVGGIPDEHRADVYVLQGRMEQFWRTGVRFLDRVEVTSYGWPEIIEWLHSHGVMVVSEMDDWMLGALPIGTPSIEAIKKRPDLSFDTLAQVISMSDMLTVTTPALAEAYNHPNTRILPNYLHWPDWRKVKPSYDRDRPKVRVGWMGVLKYRGSDLHVLRGLIGPWLERHPEVEFVSVGGGEPHDYLGIPHAQRRTLPWLKFPGHVVTTQEIDIGLVPLEPGKFNDCKSYLKGLEYAACGIPCIATPTQQYREWVDPGSNGLLARKPHQWLNALEEMLHKDAWRDMGRYARAKAEHHKIQDHFGLWEALYENRRAVPHEGPPGLHQALLPAAA